MLWLLSAFYRLKSVIADVIKKQQRTDVLQIDISVCRRLMMLSVTVSLI